MLSSWCHKKIATFQTLISWNCNKLGSGATHANTRMPIYRAEDSSSESSSESSWESSSELICYRFFINFIVYCAVTVKNSCHHLPCELAFCH